MATQRKRELKPVNKTDFIYIRVTAEQKRLLTEAAEQDGRDVSAWLRWLGLKAAEGAAGK